MRSTAWSCLLQANAALEDIERLKRQRSLFRNRDTEKIVPSHEP